MAENNYLSKLPGRGFRKDLSEEIEYARRVGGSPTAAAIRGGLASVIAAPVMAGQAIHQATEPARNAISNVAGGVADFGRQLATGEYLPPSAIAARQPTPATVTTPAVAQAPAITAQPAVNSVDESAQGTSGTVSRIRGADQFRDKGYYLPEHGRTGPLPSGVQMKTSDSGTEYLGGPKPSAVGKYQPGSLADFAGTVTRSALAKNTSKVSLDQQAAKKGADLQGLLAKLIANPNDKDIQNAYLSATGHTPQKDSVITIAEEPIDAARPELGMRKTPYIYTPSTKEVYRLEDLAANTASKSQGADNKTQGAKTITPDILKRVMADGNVDEQTARAHLAQYGYL